MQVQYLFIYLLAVQAIICGAFISMAIVSGQYFLSQINNELKMIKYNLDKILGFLYGDKKVNTI